MAALEDDGLITQPHTSAGRIPTDKGYRLSSTHLAATSLHDSNKRAIATLLSEAVDLNDVVERSVRLLSQLTRQVAVVQYPSVRESAVRRVELVRKSRERALVIVVSADARVEQADDRNFAEEPHRRRVRARSRANSTRSPWASRPPRSIAPSTAGRRGRGQAVVRGSCDRCGGRGARRHRGARGLRRSGKSRTSRGATWSPTRWAPFSTLSRSKSCCCGCCTR